MYEIEYNGIFLDASTEFGAIDGAKRAIAHDLGAVQAWQVEHDEVINVWFVQATSAGAPIGSAATVTGPPLTGAISLQSLPVHRPADVQADDTRRRQQPAHENERWVRCALVVGASPAEVFDRALTWAMQQQPGTVIIDVGWARGRDRDSSFRLKIYFREP